MMENYTCLVGAAKLINSIIKLDNLSCRVPAYGILRCMLNYPILNGDTNANTKLPVRLLNVISCCRWL